MDGNMFSYKHHPNQNMEHCFEPRKCPSILSDTDISPQNSLQSSGKPEEDGEERLLFVYIRRLLVQCFQGFLRMKCVGLCFFCLLLPLFFQFFFPVLFPMCFCFILFYFLKVIISQKTVWFSLRDRNGVNQDGKRIGRIWKEQRDEKIIIWLHTRKICCQ